MEEEKKSVRMINTKKKFVADGVFYAELNQFLAKSLAFQGYRGFKIRSNTQSLVQIIIFCAKITSFIKHHKSKARGIISHIKKRFYCTSPEKTVDIWYCGGYGWSTLSASSQAEHLREKILKGQTIRKASMQIVKSAMQEAIGCQVVVSGKLRGQRAKVQKYREGYVISAGQPKQVMVDEAIRHVSLRQGVLGIKVKIMLPFEKGRKMPDQVDIIQPKEEEDEDDDVPRVIEHDFQ